MKINIEDDAVKGDEKEDWKKTGRQIKPLLPHDDKCCYYFICVNYCDVITPEHFGEAIAYEDSNKRRPAMNHEMNKSCEKLYVDTCKTRPPKINMLINV